MPSQPLTLHKEDPPQLAALGGFQLVFFRVFRILDEVKFSTLVGIL